MKLYKYGDKEAPWSYIIIFIIIEMILTIGLPLIPVYIVWKSLILTTISMFIISFSIYVTFLLIIIKMKDIFVSNF